MLGIIASAGLLAASRFSPAWPPLDVVTHFTLHLGIAFFACLVGFLAPAARTFVALMLVFAGVVGIGAYAHYVSYGPRVIPRIEGARPLRLMTFNTSVVNSNLRAIAAELRRAQPDVAVLIEFSAKKAQILEALRNDYPFQAGCVRRRHCHFAIVSKIPIAHSVVREGWKGPLMAHATLAGEFSGITVVGVHFPRVPHIEDQFEQMASLVEYLRQMPGVIVLMGDFNATPFSRVLSDLTSSTGLRRLTSVPSWPAIVELPQLAIDHIFASREVSVLDKARVGRSSGSDHYPVVLTVAVPLAGQRDD